jgi:hypothetical protein
MVIVLEGKPEDPLTWRKPTEIDLNDTIPDGEHLVFPSQGVGAVAVVEL